MRRPNCQRPARSPIAACGFPVFRMQPTRAALVAVCRSQSVGLIVPTTDAELLALASLRDVLEADGPAACVSDSSLVAACRDKRVTGDVFSAVDIPYPTVHDKHALTFPCVCKPVNGSSSIGVSIVHTAADLTDRMLNDPQLMFMERIGNEFREYTVDAYYGRSGQLKCVVPRERIEIRAGEVSKAITHGGFVLEYLRPRLPHLAGARGCCTIQVFGNREEVVPV